MAFTAETILLAAGVWTSVWITLGAILLFAAEAMIVADPYRGATAGLLLAVTGVEAQAIAALIRRQHAPAVARPSAPAATANRADALTSREREILHAVVGGARNRQIAEDLGISERTVKAHLATIYQKLAVDSRAGAVAAAMQRGLVS